MMAALADRLLIDAVGSDFAAPNHSGVHALSRGAAIERTDARIDGALHRRSPFPRGCSRRSTETARPTLTASRRCLGSRVLRAGSSEENLVLRGARQRIVQRLSRPL